MVHLLSRPEPAAHHAFRISAISCPGGIRLCTDPRALPNVALLSERIDTSYQELHAATLG